MLAPCADISFQHDSGVYAYETFPVQRYTTLLPPQIYQTASTIGESFATFHTPCALTTLTAKRRVRPSHRRPVVPGRVTRVVEAYQGRIGY
jgi:hypothetical protein